jgi:opacity protein-like surface antigen
MTCKNPSRALVTFALLSAAATVQAQSSSRDEGWELGGQLIYQDSDTADFEGGTEIDLDADLGIGISATYRFNDRFEFMLGLDWQRIDYEARIASDAAQGLVFEADGDLESFTPYVGLNLNLLPGPFTPYVSGTVGWSFMDTNIPDAPPQNVCWWHPWYGYVCGTIQETRTLDELVYGAGAGIRWDNSNSFSVRLGYEKRWIDLGDASSTPDVDMLRLTVIARY